MPKSLELAPPPPVKPDTTIHTDNGESALTRPMFALTIGINKYLHAGELIKNLTGCVADADDVETFLSEDLDVPPANITRLRNEEATAANIIGALESFATDARIPRDAIIFIFYAGHGTQAPPPKHFNWNDSEEIQILMPYDFYPGIQSTIISSTSDTPALGEARSEVAVDSTVIRNGLADIKLGQLIDNIADSKGKNITAVFDCCHSGSATRGKELFVARGIDLPKGSKLEVDSEAIMSANRGGKVSAGCRNRGLASHVLLTACTQLEHAYEKNGRGAFTSTLMTVLRQSESLHHLTYNDIVDSLPVIHSQKPQCEGVNKHLIFLHNHSPGFRPILHKLTRVGKDYQINAGEAHGVTVGAEFGVHTTKACTNEIARLVVKKTESFHSILRPVSEGNIPPTGATFALQIRRGVTRSLRLLVKNDHAFENALNAFRQDMPATSASFEVVATLDDKPDLVITTNKGAARIEVRDSLCREAGLYEIYHKPTTGEDNMGNAIHGASRFYRNLRHTTTSNNRISSKIRLACYELGSKGIDDDLCPVMQPIDSDHNLFVAQVTNSDFLVHGHITVPIDDSERSYGFRIENTSRIPLFVSVFYFNMSDLSVDAYYQPPGARGKDQFPSIQPKSSLTIGYGSGGFLPQTFDLREGQDVDVGYIKLFLATEYVDYSSVLQRSPFEVDNGRGFAQQPPNPKLWDTMLIRVVQRREGTTNTISAGMKTQ